MQNSNNEYELNQPEKHKNQKDLSKCAKLLSVEDQLLLFSEIIVDIFLETEPINNDDSGILDDGY